MPIEKRRSCGFRKIGKIYLVGEGIFAPCDRLPFVLKPCECCGHVPTQNRGVSRLHRKYLGGQHYVIKEAIDGERRFAPCSCESICPICYPDDIPEDKLIDGEFVCLMWVGSRYYTARSFAREADEMGVCKAINQLPKGLVLGKTWILLAHPEVPIYIDPQYLKALEGWKLGEEARDKLAPVPPERPAIFYAFTPKRVEMLLSESECTPEKLKEYAERGITIIPVPESRLKGHQ